ncbi:hypothetical protein N9355_01620, partial [Crocinitomicaceae bacterium]|nr:hypothetical protein [Crocinitomicaceae bacterium]
MKHYSILLLLMVFSILSAGVANAQTTEDFETEVIGSSVFSDNGQNFSFSGGLGDSYDIETFGGGGWNGAAADNDFIDNTSGINTNGDGTSLTIVTADGADILVNNFYLFVSTNTLGNPTSPSVTVVGRRDGIQQFTFTKTTGFSNVATFSPNNGFTLFNFVTEGGSDNSNTAIDEIIITSTGNADYFALDALNWEIIACTDPTVPTLAQTPTTVCVGGTASLNITGTLNDATAWHVYTGSCGGTSIGSTATGTFAIPGVINTPTTYFVRGEGGCVTPGTCGSITITPQALDDASFSYSAASYCVNDSDPTPTITGLGGGTFSSTPGLSLNAGTGVIDVSVSTPGTYTVIYTTTGTCPNSSNVSVTVNALDDASFSYSAASYCVNDSDPTPTITGLAGGTFSSTAGLSINGGTGAIDVSASTPGTYTVTYTTTGACPNSSNVSVTVNALDDPSFSYSAASYCVSDADPTPTITGLLGGAFSSTPGLSLNGGTGAIDVSVSTPGTYTVTYTTTGSCPNSSNVNVTINGLDDASFSYSAAAYCVSDADPTPTITGLAGGGFTSTPVGLSINAGIGVIDVSASIPGLYTVIYTTTGTCPNSSIVSVTIQAAVSVTFTALADLCIDEGVQTGLGGGLPTGGVYSGPGVTDDGNGTTYSFDPAAAGAGVHIITYTVSGACTTPASDNVEVFPAVGGSSAVNVYNINTATNPLVGGVCPSNSGIDNTYNCAFDGQPEEVVGSFTDLSSLGSTLDNVAISFFSACAGDITLYLNGVPMATQTLTGLSCSCQSIASDPAIPQSISVTMTPAIQAAFIPGGVNNITATSANSAAGAMCYYGVDLTISTSSGVSFTAPSDVCIDAGVQSGLGGGTPTGGIYSGTGVTDDGNGITYSFDPAAAGLGVHMLTYTFTNANGCVGSATDDIEVLPVVTGTFTALADLCIDAGVQTALGGGLPTGGVYSGAGVTDDGNGTTYSFDPAAAGVGTHTITYTPGGSCSTAGTDQVEVFALPTVTFTALADLCIDAGVQAGLGLGTPTGGVYSGAGITDDGNGTTYSFDPAAAGVGTHTITYTFTNANGCTKSAVDQVDVFALPTVTFTALADLCVNDGVQAGLGGGLPMGGVYSGVGVTDDGNGMTYSFDPAAAGVGTHTITYTFTNANGCTSSASDNVEVIAIPTVTYTAPGPFCLTQGVQSGLGSGTPTGGVYSGTGVTDDGNGMTYSFDPAAAGVGTHTVTYTVNSGGCVGSANDDIVVTSGGAVTAICQDATIYLDANGNATLSASDIDGGSSVGCGVLNLAASQTAFTCADATLGAIPTNDLVITGVYDGPLSGGTPKGVELYVINNIADLSQYGLGSANNGGGTDGEEFTFPAVAASAGQFIYVSSEATEFSNWFGFAPDYTDGSMSINGDDAIELFHMGGVIDVFGDINTDGTGEVWDHLDGWAYRMNDTGNDGSSWTPSNWMYSGINVLDGETSNATAASPFPAGTYSITVATPTSVTLTVTDGLGGSATCDASVTILDTVSPVANCQDATVYLDGTGSASITAADVTDTGFGGYVLDQSGTFAPLASPITGTQVSLGDDAVSAALPIG